MHAILTLTLIHDRWLFAAPDPRQSTTEAFHLHRSVALFSSKMSGPIQPWERAALWATAALLAVITFCYVEARTPEDAWPLKPPSPSDLDWLRMSDGKKEIWKLTQPSKADSVLQAIDPPHTNELLVPLLTNPEPPAVPSEFIELYGLDTTVTSDNQPYYAAASSLARSLKTDCKITVIMNFLSFISDMRIDYKRLLEQKDPRALLLLAWWYGTICQYPHWWIWRRAAIECQAICMYLERYYRHETSIQTLLRYPSLMCHNWVVVRTGIPPASRLVMTI
jgi:hypothetical protein